ncbi:uncharacterized protein GGS22DRAFT_198319 [Annulohypoxylon maeteangense]|uniref:uncharacterized protein n=1 Tax=Annulohypoxylon maeteangense TaxID=1927788 RepID=UPI0020081896|nr:uncharacterized protein GGS22DRAFT_198319 [Annulohypoxylon maeteangense]KAI0880119.1 hypothetical protein GGS22DRAFT_198319 [Annulohypoxylon maeteangense]
MSIQHLPEHVVAQIKSSTTITSLNSVVHGLVKNSLDSEATKITISIDYTRGNCSVEDNGLGIPPSEFRSSGGLGKLHYTSKFPARNDIHGRHGTFIASVASLSLLSITSHHHGYRSHNTIKIHNAEILARHIPALPEQRLLSFTHGTRTTVRDLFGSMPVRVKQRAIDAERGVHAKDWERLKRGLAALLLAWSGQVSVSLRSPIDQRNFSIRIPEDVSVLEGKGNEIIDLTTRVSRVLFQAHLCDEHSRDQWVPLKASTGSISIVGAISLVPIISRQVQFISIGIQPVFNERGSNVLYEEVNRLFAHSSFGVEENSGSVDEDEQNKRAKDRRFKTDRYTNQELRGRKGVDRWPMFYIRINFEEQDLRLATSDIEGFFSERHQDLKAIVDILTAVIYEFLKAHHFRPIYSKPRMVLSEHSNLRDRHSRSGSRDSTLRVDSRMGRIRTSRAYSSVGDLASTRLNIDLSTSHLRPESPFDSWTRIKSGQPQYAHLHKNTLSGQEAREHGHSETPMVENGDDIEDAPLVAPDGALLRFPFSDVETDMSEVCQRSTLEKDLEKGRSTVEENAGFVWTNPTTKEIFSIDDRTGLVIRPRMNVDETPHVGRLPSRKKLRTNTNPVTKDERSKWLGDLLSSWDNPVFPTQEPPIPVAFDEAKALALETKASGDCCHGSNFEPSDLAQNSHNIGGRLSKDDLRNAQIIAQVDRKFILAKVPLSSTSSKIDENGPSGSSLLVMIDQHAADERCRVEVLMKDYFVVLESDIISSTEQNHQSVYAQALPLEKPIIFDISRQDSLRFELSKEYFIHWGVLFEVSSTSKSKSDSKGGPKLNVLGLPPSIAERCRAEPRLLIELLRKEAWKLDEQGGSALRLTQTDAIQENNDNTTGLHWLARFHGCPHGILEMINSRACRSSIMFNDLLSHEECVDLVKRLADCTLPFQCAHGRPSMIPVVEIGSTLMGAGGFGMHTGSFGEDFRRWKSSKRN